MVSRETKEKSALRYESTGNISPIVSRSRRRSHYGALRDVVFRTPVSSINIYARRGLSVARGTGSATCVVRVTLGQTMLQNASTSLSWLYAVDCPVKSCKPSGNGRCEELLATNTQVWPLRPRYKTLEVAAVRFTFISYISMETTEWYILRHIIGALISFRIYRFDSSVRLAHREGYVVMVI